MLPEHLLRQGADVDGVCKDTVEDTVKGGKNWPKDLILMRLDKKVQDEKSNLFTLRKSGILTDGNKKEVIIAIESKRIAALCYDSSYFKKRNGKHKGLRQPASGIFLLLPVVSRCIHP